MPKQTIYNAGIYVRLSKDDERVGESLSIENQKRILTSYVNEQGWNIVDIYVDDGYSGCSLPRKTQKTDKQNTKNPPEKKLPGGFKTYLNGFIMPF